MKSIVWSRLSPPLAAILVLSAGCGSSPEAVPGLQGCVTPPNSLELCYEAVSHRRPPRDVFKGSPGITSRLYGREEGQPVQLFVSHGGPPVPDAWKQPSGAPPCYTAHVDFEAAAQQLEGREVDADLREQRRYLAYQIRTFGARCAAERGDSGHCSSKDNQRGQAQQKASLLGGVSTRPFLIEYGADPDLPPGSAPSVQNDRPSFVDFRTVYSVRLDGAAPQPILLEAISADDDPQHQLLLRVVSGEGAEAMTLNVEPTIYHLPQSWLEVEDGYGERWDSIDWVAAQDEFLAQPTGRNAHPALPRFAMMLGRFAAAQRARQAGLEPPGAEVDEMQEGDEFLRQAEQASTFVGSAGDWRNRGRKYKQGNPGHDYQTSVTVFAKKAFLGLAIHSGTISTTRTIRHGRTAYTVVQQSCNHGACPMDQSSGMNLRFECSPGVTTHGWYGYDGECSDPWPSHTCNDDTALQINNAFGQWTEDRCWDTGRKHAPRCEIQW